jgi:hypothetical protein
MPASLRTLSPAMATQLRQHAAHTVPNLGRTHLSLLPHVYPAGHTFHLVDTELRLPHEAAIVFLDHQPTANWGHPCTYRLYHPDTGALISEHDASFPPNLAGDIDMELFHAPLAFTPQTTAPLIVNAPMQLVSSVSLVDEQRYAILFTSQISNRRHVEDVEFYWRLLTHRYGFTPSHIYVLCYNGTIGATDVGSGGIGNWAGDNTPYQMQVHAAATTANLQTVFNELATKLRPKDQLFIHTNNHGATTGLCVDSTTVITPVQFGTMLSGLPHLRSLIITMEQCYSGAFQSSVLTKSTAANTVFASAVPANKTSDGAAHFDPWAQMLARVFNGSTEAGAGLASNPLPDHDGVVPLSTACAWARTNDKSPGDDPQYADSPAGCGHAVNLALNPVRPSRAADLNGDHCAELLVSSPWGIGVLERSGNSLSALTMAANGTRLGDWLLNTADNSFGPMADYDGDGRPEVLISSPWGISILKITAGGQLAPIMMAANGTRFGGWLLNTADNRFGPAADFDGDGRAEILVQSPWGVGLLKLSGNTLTAPMMQPNGARFGGWLIDTGCNIFNHAADFDGDGRAELLAQSPWGIGLLKLSGATMVSLAMHANGSRLGGWLLDTLNNHIGRPADYDGDHRAELLITSPWGMSLLKLAGNAFTAPMMAPNGTRFGGWLFESPDNWFGPAADYDGDGHAELMILSDWGMGLLKLSGATMTAPMMQANGTRFGGWLLNTRDNQFGPAAVYYGAVTNEVLVKSPWGIGLLRQAGSTMVPTMMQPNGTRFGGWLLNTADNQF